MTSNKCPKRQRGKAMAASVVSDKNVDWIRDRPADGAGYLSARRPPTLAPRVALATVRLTMVALGTQVRMALSIIQNSISQLVKGASVSECVARVRCGCCHVNIYDPCNARFVMLRPAQGLKYQPVPGLLRPCVMLDHRGESG